MPCTYKYKDLYEKTHNCQFDAGEEELYDLDDQKWCAFHLPMEDEEGKKSEKAGWGKEKINEFNQKIYALIDAVKESENKDALANLTGVVSPGAIDFARKELPNINFVEATFTGTAKFIETTFNGDAEFREAMFNGNAMFENAKFNGNAWFTNVKISGYAGFREATFNGEAGFNYAKFNGNAWFTSAKFNGDAGFLEAMFNGNAMFENAKFSGNALFDADTDQNKKSKETYGDYFQYVNFSGCEFENDVSFINRRFLETTSFNKCTFKQAPNYHNCELHQDTDFDDAKFEDKRSKHAPRAYRTLKLAMERTRARDEQARFYAYEQQSIRNQPGTAKWVKISSWLYEMTSDYGRSALRPLVGLGVIFMCSWMIYYTLSGSNSALSGATFNFAFEQIIRPFSAWTLQGTKAVQEFAGDKSTAVRYIAVLQSILNVGLIALFILALRWRFRRG